MKIKFALLFLFCSATAGAQNCNCLLNFNSMVDRVTHNYSGYGDKVTKPNVKAFMVWSESLRQKASAENRMDSCYVILKTWSNYFKDKHLRVEFTWQFRKQHPEMVKSLNKRFSTAVNAKPNLAALNPVTEIKLLNATTLLMRFPSFEWKEKAKIDSLMAQHRDLLMKTPNWIVDIRGNGGGIDYTYSGLLPYLYTNKIRIWPDEYRSSAENMEILREGLSDPDLSAEAKDFRKNLIALMAANPDGFVNPSGKDYFETRMDSVYLYPKKVGILIDRQTASSAETFLMLAKQSKKVKLYGENTAGIIDYGSIQYFDLPSEDLKIVIPIARSKRLPKYPIDNIGISPDIRIPAGTMDLLNVVQQKMK